MLYEPKDRNVNSLKLYKYFSIPLIYKVIRLNPNPLPFMKWIKRIGDIVLKTDY